MTPHRCLNMRHILTLLAATVSVAACSPEPARLNFPVEFGAPPRALDPDMRITYVRLTLKTLLVACANTDTRADLSRPAACARRLNDAMCFVYLPRDEDTNPEDKAHMLAHELRHCAGQMHRITVGFDGTARLEWLP